MIDKKIALDRIGREARHLNQTDEAKLRHSDRDRGASKREKAARRSARTAAKLAAELERTYWELVMARLGDDR